MYIFRITPCFVLILGRASSPLCVCFSLVTPRHSLINRIEKRSQSIHPSTSVWETARWSSANAMETKPNGGEGGAVLALLETSQGICVGVSTHSRSPSVLLSQRFKKRPLNFAAALDPPLAAVALSMLSVGPSDTLLDPCCGTGTVLVGAIERGARAVGFDQAYKFASGTR